MLWSRDGLGHSDTVGGCGKLPPAHVTSDWDFQTVPRIRANYGLLVNFLDRLPIRQALQTLPFSTEKCSFFGNVLFMPDLAGFEAPCGWQCLPSSPSFSVGGLSSRM
jgi:hypothetical protein